MPVKSLCPCSKEISDYGAHNQRSHVTIRVELLERRSSWLELVRFAEDSASSEIWSSLKRADEKWITERAYENPKFVEDMVRDVALRLNADARIGRYVVDVENFESIHAHSAVARIERLAAPVRATAHARGARPLPPQPLPPRGRGRPLRSRHPGLRQSATSTCAARAAQRLSQQVLDLRR